MMIYRSEVYVDAAIIKMDHINRQLNVFKFNNTKTTLLHAPTQTQSSTQLLAKHGLKSHHSTPSLFALQ